MCSLYNYILSVLQHVEVDMEEDRHLGLQLKSIVLHHMVPKAMMATDESNERK
jgi:ABC-type microcin C transport system permease subunit YejE